MRVCKAACVHLFLFCVLESWTFFFVEPSPVHLHINIVPKTTEKGVRMDVLSQFRVPILFDIYCICGYILYKCERILNISTVVNLHIFLCIFVLACTRVHMCVCVCVCVRAHSVTHLSKP